MNLRVVCILLLISLTGTTGAHVSNEEKQTHQTTDHFLTYTMSLVGGGGSLLILYCRLEKGIRLLDQIYIDEYDDNRRVAKKVAILSTLGGLVIGGGIGYILECILQRYE